jgi:hypothetical protein
MQFHINEGSFNLPEGLQDNSMNMLLTGTSDLGLSLIVTRDRLEAGEKFDGFMDRQLKALGQQVTALEITERHAHAPPPKNETTMLELVLQFKQNGQLLYQRQRSWLLPDEKRVLVLTGASAAPITDAQKKSWIAICGSFQPRA